MNQIINAPCLFRVFLSLFVSISATSGGTTYGALKYENNTKTIVIAQAEASASNVISITPSIPIIIDSGDTIKTVGGNYRDQGQGGFVGFLR